MGEASRRLGWPRPGGDRAPGSWAVGYRPTSTPERLGLAGLGAAVAALAYPAVTGTTGLGLPCPLRTVTGVPCPLCGMTTAATELVAGRPEAALAANPLVFALAGFTLVMVVLMAARAAGLTPGPARWPPARTRLANRLVLALAVLSWGFQLHRYGWL